MVQTRSASGLTPARAPPTTPTRAPRGASGWAHVPPALTLLWLAVSLPLVAWDTAYVLLRPRSMPGGSLHWPLWLPYRLYGEVDHIYGFKQWNRGNGFTAAQSMLNVIETGMYLVYLWLWYARGRTMGVRYAGKKGVGGRQGAVALLVGFSAAVMTLSKTVLYWLNEYYSGFDNIGHNSTFDLILLWIIPNGLWLVFPTIMIYTMGDEIITQLASRTTKSE